MTAVSDIKQLKEGAASMQERDKNTQGRTPHTRARTHACTHVHVHTHTHTHTHTRTHVEKEREREHTYSTCTCMYLQSFGPLSLGGDVSL